MALRERTEISKGAPDGGSTWGDEGDSFTLQNHASVTATTTPNNLPAQTVSRPDTVLPGGEAAIDFLPLGQPLQTLKGMQCGGITALLLPQPTLTLALSVYRNIGLGVALQAGVQITQFTAGAPLIAPLASGQNIIVTNPAGNVVTLVTSQIVPAGSVVIPINAITPPNAYPVGTPGVAAGTTAIVQVGNTPAYGWLNGAGGGTPVFPANATILMPALANVAVVNGVIPVAASDNLQVSLVTSSGTVVMPLINMQPLLT